MSPATSFTEAVCKRASEDGYTLLFSGAASWWKSKTELIPAHQPIFHFTNDDRYSLWEACCVLADAKYPNLSVTLN